MWHKPFYENPESREMCSEWIDGDVSVRYRSRGGTVHKQVSLTSHESVGRENPLRLADGLL